MQIMVETVADSNVHNVTVNTSRSRDVRHASKTSVQNEFTVIKQNSTETAEVPPAQQVLECL